jgi:UDP-3-O-[3-hydroxymyristoyl] glucosamine N-acyltransferase
MSFLKAKRHLKVADIESVIGNCKIYDSPITKGKDLIITGAATLQSANSSEITFFANGSYKKYLATTNAGFCVTTEEFCSLLNGSCLAIISPNPSHTFSKIVTYLYGDDEHYAITNSDVKPEIAKYSDVHDTAQIGNGSIIKNFVTIESGAKIGKNCIIMQGSFIGKDVEIGDNCYIYDNATIMYAKLGNNVTIRSGVRIGSVGFGFAHDQSTGINKNQHIAGVIIENNADIGAGTVIDRGYLENTRIGEHTKIDSLVMVGHGATIGKYCFIAAQTGIAGSAILNDYITCGAQSGFAGHLSVSSGCTFAARSGISHTIEEKGFYSGFPLVTFAEWKKNNIVLSKIINEYLNSRKKNNDDQQ